MLALLWPTNEGSPNWLSRALWLGLLAEILLITWVFRAGWVIGDGFAYKELAENFAAEGRWGRYWEGTWYFEDTRSLGYPFVVALQFMLGLPVGAVVFLQGVLVWVAFRWVAVTLAPSRVSAWLPIVLAANPAFLAFNLRMHTEAWAVASTCAALVLAVKPSSTLRALALGGVSAFAIITRPNFLLLVPLFLGVLFFSAERPRRLRLTGVALAGLLVGLAPQVIYNVRHFDRLTLSMINSPVGSSLYVTAWENQISLADMETDYQVGEVSETAKQLHLLEEVAELNRTIGAPAHTKPWTLEGYPPPMRSKASAEQRRAALDRIAKQPGKWVQRYLSTMFWLWNTREYPPKVPRVAALGLKLVTIGLTLVGWFGAGLALWLAWKRRFEWSIVERAAAASGLMVLATTVVQAAMHCESRYTAAVRVPLFICAIVALDWALARRRATVPAPLVPTT